MNLYNRAHNCFPTDWIGKELAISENRHVCLIGGMNSVNKVIVHDGRIVNAFWLNNGVLRIDLDNDTKLFYVGFQRSFIAYGDETEPYDKNSYEKAVRECQQLREEEIRDRTIQRERGKNSKSEQPNNDTTKSNSEFEVGTLISGVGAAIGSAKKAIKEYQSIDDMASIEEASKKVFDNMESIWAKSNEPIEDDNQNWFADNDPWEQEEKKRNAKLSNFHSEIIKALKEYQNNPMLYNVLTLMIGFDSNILKDVSDYIMSHPAQTNEEFDLWAQIIVGIQQGQVTSKKDFDDCLNQMKQLLNPSQNKMKSQSKKKKSPLHNSGTCKEIDIDVDEENESKDRKKEQAQSVKNKKRVTKVTVDGEKYDDLSITGFKRDKDDADFLKPKNAFDLITKGKNKQISYYKNKWNDSMWKRDHEIKKKIKQNIVHIEEQAIVLLSYDEKLNDLIKSGKSAGFWGFGASKEVTDVKERIEKVADRISDYKDKLSDALNDLDSCEETIQDCSEKLYELTGSSKYSDVELLNGTGTTIARQLDKCKIKADELKKIFNL